MKLRHIDCDALRATVPSDLYSVGYAAKVLARTRQTILRMIRSETLAGATKDAGGAWVIPGASILATVPGVMQMAPPVRTETPTGRAKRASASLERIRKAATKTR